MFVWMQKLGCVLPTLAPNLIWAEYSCATPRNIFLTSQPTLSHNFGTGLTLEPILLCFRHDVCFASAPRAVALANGPKFLRLVAILKGNSSN